jgi:NADH-quinone oxidoreductase subunit L
LKAPVEKLLTSARIPAFEVPENVEVLVKGAEHTAVGVALVGL